MNAHIKIALGICSLTIAGCGVSIESKRVSSDNSSPLPSFISGEGVVYALPRTDYEITQSVKISLPTAGPLQDTLAPCLRACEATKNNIRDKSCKFSSMATLRYATPALRTVTGPDPSRVYQVSATAETFQSIDFKFSIGQNGVLDSADTSASNMSYEIISSLATNIIKNLEARSLAFNKNESKGKATPSACYALSLEIGKLLDSKTGDLSCDQARRIDLCMAQYNTKVDATRRALDTLYDYSAKSKLDSKLLTAIAENRRNRINTAIAERDEAGKSYGLGESNPKEAIFDLTIPVKGPSEFKGDIKTLDLSSATSEGKIRISSASENSATLRPTLIAYLLESPLIYDVKTTMPEHIATVSDKKKLDSDGHGFRYRIPTEAETTLTVYSKDAAATGNNAGKTNNIVFGPIIGQKMIAQYGPVASLTSRFTGKGGKVSIKIWPESGGIQTVEIGADAMPTSSITSVTDEVLTQYKARRDKAATADPELDNLSRQQKLLDLQNQIKALQKSLKD